MAATEPGRNLPAGSGATAPTLKIAYVLPNIEAGGAEGHLLSLVRRLDRSRFSPFLVTTAGGGSLYESFRSLLPVSVIGDTRQARARPPKNPFAHLQAIRDLAGSFRAHSPDIVHCYLPAANVLGPIAARRAGIPRVVVSKRSLPDYKKGHPFLKGLESWGNLLSDVVMVNSDAVRRETERTERFWKGKFRRVYNGVGPIEAWDRGQVESFRAREGLPIGSPVAVCVSNFFEYKGHEDLVRAAARVGGDLPELTWVLIGRDAGSLETSRALAKDLGILERIRFIGARFDVPDFLRAADLFVHPSRQEGFSNAVLEAMAAGLPVVACAVGGNPEAVVDGVTGRLVPPRDPTALAAAMGEILADSGKGRSMGEAGRERATERFSLDRMVGEIEEMYDSLMLRESVGK